MTVLDATLEVPPDRRLTLDLPAGCDAARVRVTVTAEPAAARPGPAGRCEPGSPASGSGWLVIPTDFGADWDPEETFRREDMYGDDGR